MAANLKAPVTRILTAGPPATQTYETDAVVIDNTGTAWHCLQGGTPGTWEQWPTPPGLTEYVLHGTVARTETSAKTLGTLPAGAVITGLAVSGPTASDAGTTATLSVGTVGGSGHDYLNALDVTSGGSGVGQHLPSGTVLGSVGGAAVTVTGTYAETGTPSTTGGPWTVVIRFTTG
jgi:hypothetical protein